MLPTRFPDSDLKNPQKPIIATSDMRNRLIPVLPLASAFSPRVAGHCQGVRLRITRTLGVSTTLLDLPWRLKTRGA